MSAMSSQINGDSIVCFAVCSGADHRKHQSFASLAFARGIHRWPVDSPHKGPVTRKCFHLMTSSCCNLVMDDVSLPQLTFCGRPHFLSLKISLYLSWCRYKGKADSNNVREHKVTKSVLVHIPYYLPHLTYWGPEQMAPFCRRHFQILISRMKCIAFWFKLH